MKAKIIALAVIVLLIATSGFLLLQLTASKAAQQPKVDNRPTATRAPVTPLSEQYLQLVNKARADNGLSPLKLDERLNRSAQIKAEDQTANKYSGHVNPTTGKRGISYAFETMPSCTKVSENLAYNTEGKSPEYLINGLMNSPSHRAAILDPEMDYVGFGYTNNELVQHFCTTD